MIFYALLTLLSILGLLLLGVLIGLVLGGVPRTERTNDDNQEN